MKKKKKNVSRRREKKKKDATHSTLNPPSHTYKKAEKCLPPGGGAPCEERGAPRPRPTASRVSPLTFTFARAASARPTGPAPRPARPAPAPHARLSNREWQQCGRDARTATLSRRLLSGRSPAIRLRLSRLRLAAAGCPPPDRECSVFAFAPNAVGFGCVFVVVVVCSLRFGYVLYMWTFARPVCYVFMIFVCIFTLNVIEWIENFFEYRQLCNRSRRGKRAGFSV